MRRKSKDTNNLQSKRKAGENMTTKNAIFMKLGRNLFSYADFSNSIFMEKKKSGEYTYEKEGKKRGYRKTYKDNQ